MANHVDIELIMSKSLYSYMIERDEDDELYGCDDLTSVAEAEEMEKEALEFLNNASDFKFEEVKGVPFMYSSENYWGGDCGGYSLMMENILKLSKYLDSTYGKDNYVIRAGFGSGPGYGFSIIK